MTHDELVEKMMDGYDSTADNGYRKFCRDEAGMAGMSAALHVAIGEMLCDPSREEYAENPALHVLLRARRYLYLKPKSAEERVTIGPVNIGLSTHSVMVDGVRKIALYKSDAEIYRLGLIETLKKEQSS